jgi:hypothetical protein
MSDETELPERLTEEDGMEVATDAIFRKYSESGFSIYSDQPGYELYHYCPYSGETLSEEEV